MARSVCCRGSASEGARVGDRGEIPQVPQFKTLWRLCIRPGQPNRFRL